jgi:adenylate kinase
MLKKIFHILLLCTPLLTCAGKNFVLIAPPGSGKGTFSQYIVEKYGYCHICPGDLFRNEIRKQTDLGKQIQPIVERGDYIDDAITWNIMEQYLNDAITRNVPFILDGFPRSVETYNRLKQYVIQRGIVTDVCFLELASSDDTCAQRVIGRIVCPSCSFVYNYNTLSPEGVSACDHCHAKLERRSADTPEVIRKRLKYYHEQIEPLLQHAQKDVLMCKKIITEQTYTKLKELYDDLVTH